MKTIVRILAGVHYALAIAAAVYLYYGYPLNIEVFKPIALVIGALALAYPFRWRIEEDEHARRAISYGAGFLMLALAVFAAHSLLPLNVLLISTAVLLLGLGGNWWSVSNRGRQAAAS